MIARPRHIERLTLLPLKDAPGVFAGPHAGPFSHPVRCSVDIDAQEYPLEQHCRYVRKRNDDGPATFSNMVFSSEGPGLRVGPWPGWRGIPELPVITLSLGGSEIPLTVQWWGDELTQRHLRAVAWLPSEGSGEIRCSAGDHRLTPRSIDLFEDHQIQIVQHPTRVLSALEERHPRLLLTEDDLAGLRQRAVSTHRVHMERISALLAAPFLPPEVTPESKTPIGPERLRPEDRAVLAAFVALIDPSPVTVDSAIRAYREFVKETRRPGFEPLEIDTQSGEMLFLLVLVYDWLNAVLSEEERADIRAWLWKVADRVRLHLGPDRRDFGQAHYLGCALGILSFSCVFWKEHPKAGMWLDECRGAFDVIMAMLPEDGFHPHGANMWIYEYGFLFRWLEIFRVCTGENLWGHPHWRNASAFRGATLSPDALYGITFGDPQYRVGGDAWCHYLVAARTGSRLALSLGDALVDGPHAGIDFRSVTPRRRVYEFLYSDPAILPEEALPAIRQFSDGGQVTVRTGIDRDGLFTFKAGPPIGATRYDAGERGGYGHADPCNGAFLWYSGGSLVVSGPGPTYRRDSALHNIITVNGQGQIGDGTVWVPDFFPPEVLSPRPEVLEARDVVSVSVNLASNYLPHLGVERCHRALLIDPARRRVVGVDDVRCGASSILQWNLHSHASFALSGTMGLRSFRATVRDTALTVFLILPPDGDLATGLSEVVPAYPNDGTPNHFLRWSVTGIQNQFVWYLTLEQDPVPPVMEASDNAMLISFSDGGVIRYDGERLRMMEGR